MNTVITDPWLRWAKAQTRALRSSIRRECAPFHHWPIIVKGFFTYLPLDTMPAKHLTPLNDP